MQSLYDIHARRKTLSFLFLAVVLLMTTSSFAADVHTHTSTANISIGKARTAALFKRPTKFFEDVINKGRTAMSALPDFTPLQGGVPIVVDDQIIGAVGVSGAASAQQDEALAIAGANVLATPAATAER